MNGIKSVGNLLPRNYIRVFQTEVSEQNFIFCPPQVGNLKIFCWTTQKFLRIRVRKKLLIEVSDEIISDYTSVEEKEKDIIERVLKLLEHTYIRG